MQIARSIRLTRHADRGDPALPRSWCSSPRSLRQWPRLLAAAGSGPGAHHRDGGVGCQKSAWPV